MTNHFVSNFLSTAQKQFSYYRLLGEKTMLQLTDDQLFWAYNAESNSIAAIVKHLSGNMLSRWTDFLTTDGEKAWRNRDEEFNGDFKNRDDLMTQWRAGWDCLANALDTINEAQFKTEIFIRNEGHTVLEAINRQLAHYPYHIGQMVFIGKMLCNDTWQSLSIAKGQSGNYNSEKFAAEKKTAHFTDDYLSNDCGTPPLHR